MALFLAACATPAIQFRPSTGGGDMGPFGAQYGWLCLAEGWIYPIFGVLGLPDLITNPNQFSFVLGMFSWLANPLLLIGWAILRWRPRAAAILSVIALSLGVLYPILPHDSRPLIGTYLWIGSIGVMAIGATATWRALRLPRLA
jgi:hypothetical protein